MIKIKDVSHPETTGLVKKKLKTNWLASYQKLVKPRLFDTNVGQKRNYYLKKIVRAPPGRVLR